MDVVDRDFTTMTIFSTGDLARLTGSSIATTKKWFDRNLIRGFSLPGSKQRRAMRKDVVVFLHKHAMPTIEELTIRAINTE